MALTASGQRARAIELGDLFAELHREMLTVAVSALSDEGDLTLIVNLHL